jgi:transposase IS66 family protein
MFRREYLCSGVEPFCPRHRFIRHGVIDVIAKRALDGARIRTAPIHGELDTVGEAAVPGTVGLVAGPAIQSPRQFRSSRHDPLCPHAYARLESILRRRLEIDNNVAERAIRGLAIGGKTWLFAGSEAGGQTAAIAYTLIETTRLTAVDPQAWLTDAPAASPIILTSGRAAAPWAYKDSLWSVSPDACDQSTVGQQALVNLALESWLKSVSVASRMADWNVSRAQRSTYQGCNGRLFTSRALPAKNGDAGVILLGVDAT